MVQQCVGAEQPFANQAHHHLPPVRKNLSRRTRRTRTRWTRTRAAMGWRRAAICQPSSPSVPHLRESAKPTDPRNIPEHLSQITRSCMAHWEFCIRRERERERGDIETDLLIFAFYFAHPSLYLVCLTICSTVFHIDTIGLPVINRILDFPRGALGCVVRCYIVHFRANSIFALTSFIREKYEANLGITLSMMRSMGLKTGHRPPKVRTLCTGC